MAAKIDEVTYWNPISGQYQTTAPTFPVAHWGGMNVRATNIGTTDIWIALRFYTYNPDGSLRDEWQTSYYLEVPGSSLSANHAVYCDVPGDYTQKVDLLVQGIGVVDTVQEIICHATAAPELFATIGSWRLWNAVEGAWVWPRPSLMPPGSDIGVQVRCWNQSAVTLNIRSSVRYTSPSGRRETLTGSIYTVAPGALQYVGEFLWAGDESGEWECDIVLYAGLPGQALVEVDRRDNAYVAHVGTLVPPEEPEFQDFAITEYVSLLGG